MRWRQRGMIQGLSSLAIDKTIRNNGHSSANVQSLVEQEVRRCFLALLLMILEAKHFVIPVRILFRLLPFALQAPQVSRAWRIDGRSSHRLKYAPFSTA